MCRFHICKCNSITSIVLFPNTTLCLRDFGYPTNPVRADLWLGYEILRAANDIGSRNVTRLDIHAYRLYISMDELNIK